MSEITYMVGDATHPQRLGSGPELIAHIVNDIGAWGAGFTRAISARWPEAEADYREWMAAARRQGDTLGSILVSRVEPALHIVHMVAQQGLRSARNPKPLNLRALSFALEQLGTLAIDLSAAAIHMPRIGTGLAGGDWIEVEPMLRHHLVNVRSLPVFVYDLPSRKTAR